jgi:hypothetical protein
MSLDNPPYLRDVNTKRVWIYTDHLARMANMEPYYPKSEKDDPCLQGAKMARDGLIRTDTAPYVDHTPPPVARSIDKVDMKKELEDEDLDEMLKKEDGAKLPKTAGKKGNKPDKIELDITAAV